MWLDTLFLVYGFYYLNQHFLNTTAARCVNDYSICGYFVGCSFRFGVAPVMDV